MFFIYGAGTRKSNTRYTVNAVCERCGMSSNMRVIQTSWCFTLFFIPIIKSNRKYYAECPHCSSVTMLEKSDMDKVKECFERNSIYNLNNNIVENATVVQNNNIIEAVKEEDNELILKIKEDIDKIIVKIKDKNLNLENNKEFYFKKILRQKLVDKYNDEKLVDKALDRYFKLN